MGSNEDAATASAQAEAIKDLQAQLAAAQAANAALQAVVDADTKAVEAPAKGKGPVLPLAGGGSGSGVPRQPAGGRAGGGNGDGGRDGAGEGSVSSPSSSSAGRGGGGRHSPPSSSTEDEPDLVHSAFDDIDEITIGKPGVYLQDYELPRRAARPGRLPVLFEPNEVEFRTAFADNVRDRMEATSLYQVCYWLQEAINSACNAYHDHTGYTAAELEECLGGYVIYLRRIHRMTVKRFDYLETRQTDQLLAKEYERADLLPTNQHRGTAMRKFRAQRDTYRLKNAAKVAAYHAGASDAAATPKLKPKPKPKPNPKADKAGGGGGGGGRDGGGGGGGGGCGGQGGGRKRGPRGGGGGGDAAAADA